ncbi:MAG: leucine-rich repeat domain-containing protein [Bacteriovoracaceae bacterium]|nr:leucine-rich repeat domain-containing protein [Bacteriovoracaceae bacterium]
MKARLIKLRKNQSSFPSEILFEQPWECLEIQGEGIESLPYSLGEISTLRTLSINCPNLKEVNSNILCHQNLQIFKLRNTSIESLPEVENSAPLKTLFLSGNSLTSVPKWFSNLDQLELLDLSGNNLKSVPREIESMKSMRRLVLDRNEITTLPDFIKNLKDLGHLSIDGNKFSPEEKARIGREFGIWF